MRAAVWGRKRMGIGREPSRDALRFLGMTLALSWGMWVPLAVLRLGGTSGGMSGGSVVLLAFPGVLVPGVVAVVLVARAGGRKAVRAIEVSQLMISILLRVQYKSFDVDDLVLNALGGASGYLLWRCGRHLLRNSPVLDDLIERMRLPRQTHL